MDVYNDPRMELLPANTPVTQARWELYRLLSEPVRLRLLALASVDALAVGELAELLGELQPNVSRHVAALRHAGLVQVRRHGTWALVRVANDGPIDPVVEDALRTGRSLCDKDGSLARVADVVGARERSTREFFARSTRGAVTVGPPPELAAYLLALAPLIERRALAVDVGTGDGRLLEILAPVFHRVLAIDRAGAQLAMCAERVSQRGFGNVELVEGEVDGPEVKRALKRLGHAGADVVFASRVLHHAPRPADTLRRIAALAAPGGAVMVLDYGPHEDEALRAQQADLWLGFEADELRRFAREAGLEQATVVEVPAAWRGNGPDRAVPWTLLSARVAGEDRSTTKGAASAAKKERRR